MHWQGWQDSYNSKPATADEAISRRLKNGSRILIGSDCGTPQHLVHTLASHLGKLIDVGLIYSIVFGPSPFIQEHLRHSCRVKTFFVTETLREDVFE